jgi:putative endonuclease
MKSQEWFVYIIQNEKGHLYTGITTDLERRFAEHRSSKRGAKFFRQAPAIDVVFTQKFNNRSEASRAEVRIKKMSRLKKMELLQNGILV